jgi:hypothetical protein
LLLHLLDFLHLGDFSSHSLGSLTDSLNLLLKLSFFFLRFRLVLLLVFLGEDWFRLQFLRLGSIDGRDSGFWLYLLNFRRLIRFSF